MKTPDGRPLTRAEESEALFWHGLDRQAIDTLGAAACDMLRTAHATGDPWPVVEALDMEHILAEAELGAPAA